MNRIFASLFLVVANCLGAPVTALATTIPTVPVGDVGNANDSTGFGAVNYAYRIGTTEVTNAQYADFLNAKAKSDPLGLYSTSMGNEVRGGIARTGVSPNFSYEVKTDMANKPVNYVTWYAAIRFANWLNNGQGAGDTETGAYTLDGSSPTPSNGDIISRNTGAKWVLANENEWYKSAYFDPRTTAEGGPPADSNYWLYPTMSNTAPTIATAIDAVGPTRGDIAIPGLNVANYFLGADWNGTGSNVTTVGSAGPLSQSFYGTSDQGGNVYEWNEALISDMFRGLRGGSFFSTSENLQSTNRISSFFPINGDSSVGFRVAFVPEPTTASLAVFACGLIWVLRKWLK